MGERSCIACQISFIPIENSNVNLHIEGILRIITKAFPDCEVNDMSTIVKGSKDAVFDLLSEITSEAERMEVKFSLQVTISNICGCRAK